MDKEPIDNESFKEPFGDKAAQKALDFLRTQAKAAGLAKARVIEMEAFIKITKSELTKRSQAKSVAAQEIEALCQPEYKNAVELYANAVAEQEELFWKRVAAEATIEAWRTHSSNQRGEKRIV